MPYCSVDEAWGPNFKNLVKPRKAITPPRPKLDDYKIEEGMVGSADTGAYASFQMTDKSKARRERYSNKMEPLEYQRGMGVKRLESDVTTGGPITDSFIEDLYYSKNNTKEEPSPYSLMNSANANQVVSDKHLQNQYRKYIDYIEKLEKRITQLEEQLQNERKGRRTNNFYNIVLYIFAGVFIIFLLDCFVRLGKCLNTHGGLGATLKLSKQAAQRILPTNLPLPTQPLPSNYFQPAQLNPLHKFTEYRY